MWTPTPNPKTRPLGDLHLGIEDAQQAKMDQIRQRGYAVGGEQRNLVEKVSQRDSNNATSWS